MVNFFDSADLIGLWPLSENSGIPSFHNFAPSYAGKPSGLSVNLMVHTVLPDTPSDETRMIWPGTTTQAAVGTSGIPFTNVYKAQGNHTLGLGTGEHTKVLIAGEGGQISRGFFLPPRIAQSGFTVGFWVNPQTNGRFDRVSPRAHAKAHSLVTLCEEDSGWMIGVSGSLTEAAQNSLTTGNPRGLAAFVVGLHNNTVANSSAFHLNTPIESGKFTHLTFSYRITAAAATTDVAYVLYKDGRVTASGSTAGVTNGNTLTLTNTNLTPRALGVGTSVEETTQTDRYSHATGWGHLISGVYYFNRVLNEGEILNIHNGNRLQPSLGIAKQDSQQVLITDTKLISYFPFLSPGYADASKNHYPLISDIDEGDESNWVVSPGPYGRMGIDNFAAADLGLAAGSGIMNSLISNKSFTIAGRFSPQNSVHDFDSNMIFSLGECETTLASTLNNACFYVTTDTGNVRYLARIFPLGLSSTAVVELREFEINPFSKVNTHVAFIYDDQTKGVALYTNGQLQQSGTLAHSLSDQVLRVANSGFPLVFLQGVSAGILGDTTPYIVDTTGEENGSEFTIFGRPLLATEVLNLAQSGINISSLLRTVHDPRLVGYWPCTGSDPQALVIPDMARVWEDTPANLIRSTNDVVWNNIEATDTSIWYRRDEFSRLYTITDALQISNSPLGITSGVWTVNGGSLGIDFLTAAKSDQKKSSINNMVSRFRPIGEQRNQQATIPYQYLIAFDITPSGNIKSHTLGAVLTNRFNGLIHYDGNETLSEIFYSYLTNNAHTVGQAPGSSGVTIVFEGRDGAITNTTQIASGNLSFGIPNKVLLHTYFGTPYYFGDANGAALVNVDLYINGIKQYSRSSTSTSLRLWSDGAQNSANDRHVLQFGGCSTDPDLATHISNGETGLGEIRLRNIFLMKGIFSNDDIGWFANSGIVNAPSIAGYTNEQLTTQVTVKTRGLQGYWRFSGGSGHLDLSTAQNNLVPLARLAADQGLFSNTTDNPLTNLRFMPGPLLRSDLGIQASGVGYEANAFTGNVVPPFVASGAIFSRPDFGFSIGMWFSKQDTIATTTAYQPIITFGVLPSTNNIGGGAGALTNIDKNRSWGIVWDSNENLHMVISQSGTGSMYFSPGTASAASSGTIVCGAFTSYINSTTSTLPNDYKIGGMTPGHIDSWNHVLWSYDAVTKYVTCYLNGIQVDQKYISNGINLPLDESARMISFLIPQTGVWQWLNSTTTNDINSWITDVCYFSTPLTAAQARYIPYFGIDDAPRTTISGILGGFIRGLDTVSGLAGGFIRGLDTVSGIIGGYLAGSTPFSGLIGGFTHGLAVVSGLAGGLIIGGQIASGLIGGWLQSSAQVSGLIGGYIIGGLSGLAQFDGNFNISAIGSKNFDAILEIRKQTFADFDATVFIYQDEEPPDIGIIIPGNTVTGLVPTFDQYFIGAASGKQGKTITNTKWNFSDFTGNYSVSVSGSNFYPISHKYTTSGVMIARFTAIDSHGIQNSATRIINIASGISTVEISLSGQPRQGFAELIVDFQNKIENTPVGVSITRQLLDFDDGKTSIQTNPSHGYTQPGKFIPMFIIVDGRGFMWSDSLEAGQNNA